MQRNKILCFFATIIIASSNKSMWSFVVEVYLSGSLQRVLKKHPSRGSYFPVSVCLALSFLRAKH